MNYITALNLLEHLGKNELRMSVIGKLNADIDVDLLSLTVSGGDTTAYQGGSVSEVNRALSLINNAITASTNLMNGYIPKWHSFPLSNAVIASSPLPGICIKLVRYELALTASEQVTHDKKDAMQQLRDIAKGLIALGEDDPQNTQASGAVCVRSAADKKHYGLTSGFGR